MASVDVQVETVIQRPRGVVGVYAADPTNAPAWYANIKSVQWRTSPPVRVGSRMDFMATLMGRRIAYTYEVAELVPGERLVMRASDGPMAMETTYTWTDEGDGTRMRLRNCGGPSGFAKLTAPIMAAAVRRATTKDLARLKEILEGQAWPTSGPPRVGPARLMSEARSQLDDPTTRRPAPVLASSASSVALIRGWTTLSKRRGMTLTGPRMLVHRIWPNGAQTNPL